MSGRREPAAAAPAATAILFWLAAAAGAEGMPAGRSEAIDRFLGGFADLAMFDGTVLVDIGGEVVYERSFGRAHHELDVAHVAPDDPRLGRYSSSRGAMVLADAEADSITALVPLTDGAFLQPLYFQRCEQAAATRVITCRMLSGDPRYTTELTPAAVIPR